MGELIFWVDYRAFGGNARPYFEFGGSMAIASPHQLFPRRAVIEFPKTKPSADSLGEVEADDGLRYFVKADSNGRPTRACEWISTLIAEEVGISAPTPMPIEMKDGTVVFWSRKISGTSDDVITRNFLLKASVSNFGNPPSAGLQSLLSSIYAFDMFLFNDDRHFGNYLSCDDSGTRRLYAFDFSRCLFWAWPWNGFPSAQTHTRQRGAELRRLHGFDTTVATRTLDHLETLPSSAVDWILGRMPANWLNGGLRADFVGWWADGLRRNRADVLRKGLIDGTLL